MVYPRIFSGCSRIDSVIYCKDGYIQQTDNGKLNLANEHISLDLSQININDNEDTYFSMFNPLQLKWKQLSNINYATGNPTEPTAYSTTAILNLEKSYVTYGGLKYDNTGNITALDYPFMKYNILNDTWYPLPPFSTTAEFLVTSLINMGNDVFWKYGGLIPKKESIDDIGYSIFNYKNLTWTGPILHKSMDLLLGYTCSHTLTLVETTIYKFGGSTSYVNNRLEINYEYSPLMRDIITFDTTNMAWSSTAVNGFSPSRRDYHTATYLPDKHLILIYGGAITFGQDISVVQNDRYVIYNITSNSYMQIEEPAETPFPRARFGHYATLYNSNYLLLMFGGISKSQLSDVINVINITNPLKPVWLANTDNTSNNGELGTNANHQLSTTTLIIIIVISVSVFLVLVGAIVFYIWRKAKEKKDNIQLEKEDPRKSEYVLQGYYKLKPNSDEDAIIMKKKQKKTEILTLNDDNYMDIDDCIKPSQIIFCKASDSPYDEKTLYETEKGKEINDSKRSTLNSNNLGLRSSLLLSSPTLTVPSIPSTPFTEIQSPNENICKPSISEN